MTDDPQSLMPDWPEPRTAAEPDDGRTSLALAGGLIAAAAGGLIWAAIGLIAQLEIGWAAWGVGALVGGAMGRITAIRSPRLAVAAAGLAAVGLLVGKLVITLGSAGAISEELLGTPEYLAGALAWEMYDAEELDVATQESVTATLQAGDTLSNAIWAEMLRQAGDKIMRMTDDERRGVADGVAETYVAQLGLVDGILVQLSAWDLLWFGLALATAFRMMAGAKPEEAPAEAMRDGGRGDP